MLYYPLLERAWEECVELQTQPKDVWIGYAALAVQDIDRKEVLLFKDSRLIGGLVLAHDFDVHVGKCLSVLWQYVLPEYRNSGASMRLMRYAVQCARDYSYSVLAYTHRVGNWRYETIYRKVRHG